MINLLNHKSKRIRTGLLFIYYSQILIFSLFSAPEHFIENFNPIQDRRKTALLSQSNERGTIYTLRNDLKDITERVFLPKQNKKINIDGYFYEDAWAGESFFMEDKSNKDSQDLPVILLSQNNQRIYAAIQIPKSIVQDKDKAHFTFSIKNPLRGEHIKFLTYLNNKKEQHYYIQSKRYENQDNQYLRLLDFEAVEEGDFWQMEVEILTQFSLIKNVPGVTLNFYTEFDTGLSQYRYPKTQNDNMSEAPFLILGTEVEGNQYLDRLMFSKQHDLKFFYFETIPGKAHLRKAKFRIVPNPGDPIKNNFSLKLSLLQNKKLLWEKDLTTIHGYDYIFDTKPTLFNTGKYQWLLQSFDGDQLLKSVTHNFEVLNIKDPMETNTQEWTRIPLKINQPLPKGISTWHFRTGIPFSKGAITEDTPLKIVKNGKEIPFQKEVLATWAPKGAKYGHSVRWLGLDIIDNAQVTQQPYTLLIGHSSRKIQGLDIQENNSFISVNNGILELQINKSAKGFNLFQQVKYKGKLVFKANKNHGPYITHANGTIFRSSYDPSSIVRIEKQGPLSTTIKAEGWFVNPEAITGEGIQNEPTARPKGGFCRYTTRMTISYQQPDIKIQHTFIFTENSWETQYGAIGIALPLDSEESRFDNLTSINAKHYSLLQYHYDKYKVLGHQTSTSPLTEGKKSKGLFTSKNFYVKVKNFWQNYPKEIEVDQPNKMVSLHLWPKHGIPRKDSQLDITEDNAFILPFVHSGNILDFNVPKELNDEKHYKGRRFYWGNLKSAYKANSLGVSKTHDLIIGFSPDDAQLRSTFFETSPHLLADPVYTASTEAMGPLTASDSNKWPLLEHRFNNSYHWVLRAMDQYGSYGMWNYGDVNHGWFLDKKEKVFKPLYKRLWAGLHHGYMRTPWWLYVRNGDPKFLKQAKAHALHIADIDLCHWSNEKFGDKKHMTAVLTDRKGKPTSGYAAHKKVGGICDYKGYVHWHGGARNRYNSAIDFLLYDYYLTGNLRSWDAAIEHGQYIWKTLSSPYGRGGAGIIDTMVDLYQATWDEQIGKSMTNYVRSFINQPYAKHSDKAFWAPWFTKYLFLTGDPEAAAYARYCHRASDQYNLQLAPALYYLSGDPEMAKFCAKKILLSPIQSYISNDAFDGIIGRLWRPWNFAIRSEMLAQKASTAYKLKLDDLQTDKWKIWTGMEVFGPTLSRALVKKDFNGHYPWTEDTKLQRLTLKVFHPGKTQSLRLGTIQQSAPGTKIKIFGPDNQLIHETYIKGYWRHIRSSGKILKISFGKKGETKDFNGKRIKANKYGRFLLKQTAFKNMRQYWGFMSEFFTLTPKHPKGVYRIVYEGPQYTIVPPLSIKGKFWIETGKDSIMSLAGLKYFYVPKNVEKFSISFFPTYNWHRFTNKLRIAGGAVYAPDLSLIGSIKCGLKWDEPYTLNINTKKEHRGKVWCIAGGGYTITEMKGISPHIASSQKAFHGKPFTP